jgi:alpha-glucosidase
MVVAESISMPLDASRWPEGPAVGCGVAGDDDVLPWWKTATVYQIYPRSFADHDGDGVGDLRGVIDHLDHLAWLGVDALWLSPFYPSPMRDFGYDVSDYCDVDSRFGTLDDFDALVSAAHERGLRVIIDWVPNHTSDQHPWFRESRSGRSSPKRAWYVWRDPAPDGGPPNNWVAAFVDGPAWTLDEASGQYYLHLFLPEQPDLDWNEPAVEEAMHGVVRFWLDRGVDGFRIDVVHCLGKDPSLPDDPPEYLPIPHSALHHDPATHRLLRGLRETFDAYPGDRMMVGEVFLLDTAMVAEYYGEGDELHLAFNFPPLFAPWEADAWRRQLAIARRELDAVDAWPVWVLSNHDSPRHRSRYGSEARARAAAVLLLGLRGTPFLFAGEELGLEDAVVPADRLVDPGGRDGCRAPIPWDATPDHGWPVAGGGEPWLPWPPDPDPRNVASLGEDRSSILHLYRRLLAARRSSPALHAGDQSPLETPGDVLGWRRRAGADERVILVNFADASAAVPPATLPRDDLRVVVASDGVGDGAVFTGVLGPEQAVLLARSGPDPAP